MNKLLNLFRRHGLAGGSRFDRYYGDVVRAGVGYPTADEARRDMLRVENAINRYGWVR